MSEKNKTILRNANAAVAKGDYEGFLAHVTDDTEWTFVGDVRLVGKEAVRQWMAETYREPPKVSVDDLIAEGDLLTAIGTVSMTDEDGIENRYSYCDVWRVRDGKLADLRAFVVECAED